VDQHNLADSPLLKLFDFKGPMFGVLDQAELDIVKNWLSSGLNESSLYRRVKLARIVAFAAYAG
jgi:hypothetical protein